MVHTWPVTLRDRELVLRPLQRRDRSAFESLRRRNDAWLRPWDATDPENGRVRPPFATLRRWNERQAKEGTSLPLAIVVDGRLGGQITASPILYGPQRSAVLGYWIDQRLAGRGIVPRAAALMIDHLFAEMGLHRVEVTVRPENTASIRVVQKLGLRPEGLRRSAIHVDGAWRDHLVFALTAEEVVTGSPGHPGHPGHPGRGVLDRLLTQNSPDTRPA